MSGPAVEGAHDGGVGPEARQGRVEARSEEVGLNEIDSFETGKPSQASHIAEIKHDACGTSMFG